MGHEPQLIDHGPTYQEVNGKTYVNSTGRREYSWGDMKLQYMSSYEVWPT